MGMREILFLFLLLFSFVVVKAIATHHLPHFEPYQIVFMIALLFISYTKIHRSNQADP